MMLRLLKDDLQKPLTKLTFAENFDKIITNDDLDKAKQEVYETVKEFLEL